MITFEILNDDEIIVIEVHGPLSEDDFEQLTSETDLYLTREGTLKGLLIHVKTFPGWKSFAGMVSHIRFVRDHHRKIRRIALASDSSMAEIVPRLMDHFIEAEVKRFDFDEQDAALTWLRQTD